MYMDRSKFIMNKVGRQKPKALPIHIACVTGNKSALKNIISSVSRRALEVKDCLGRTPLILTVSCNHIDCTAVLLKAGATVDNTDNAGQTPLHIAAFKGFHQTVKLLLSYKASVMQRDFVGATSLHMAAIHPNAKGLSLIVKHVKPAEIDVQDSNLKTAVHWSAAYACNDNIKVLLANGANACIPDGDGKTPLHWAVADPNPEALDCVKTLLKNEPNLINWQDYQGRSPLHVAVASGSEEILYFLASRENCNVDVLDNSFCTPLHFAAKRGLSEKADILLKKRASHLSIDDNGATPLHYAAHNNHAETVEIFTSKNYINDEPDKFGRNALMWAAIKNALEAAAILASLTSSVSYVDRNGVTALHAAAIYGHVPVIEILIKAGIHVDVKDKYGMTPFLRACEFGRAKAALALSNLGANLDETDHKLCCALHWCAKGGHAYLTELLIRRGANYNILDRLSMTPLHYTSMFGDFINCTCVLIESGASPNVTDSEDRTPLHLAVLNERIGIVKYLCDHDCDVNAMFLLENEWVTPYDCAILKCNTSIATLLESYGGIQAEKIREYAAEVIQTWYRKKKRLTPFGVSDFSAYPKCIPVSVLPSRSFSSKEFSCICNRCFEKAVCAHICYNDQSDLFKTATYIPKPAWSCEISEQHNNIVHIDGNLINSFMCHLVLNKANLNCRTSENSSYKDIAEHKAAKTIQKCWKQYITRKRFANVRNEIKFSGISDDVRLKKEKNQKGELLQFYKLLTR